MLKCISNLDNEIHIEENIKNLINIVMYIDDCEKYIIEMIDKNSINKVMLSNYISVKLYESGFYSSVIPILKML